MKVNVLVTTAMLLEELVVEVTVVVLLLVVLVVVLVVLDVVVEVVEIVEDVEDVVLEDDVLVEELVSNYHHKQGTERKIRVTETRPLLRQILLTMLLSMTVWEWTK